MSKKERTVRRQVDGFVWLARHSLRDEIVAFVTGKRKFPAELEHDRSISKIMRDRAVWDAAHPDGEPEPSLRVVADQLRNTAHAASYEMVRKIIDVYSSGGPERVADQKRLKLKAHARRAITPAVIARYDRGELTAADVAALIGNGADYRNAAYWIERMRELHSQQAGEPSSR